jgi:hypothetical protein
VATSGSSSLWEILRPHGASSFSDEPFNESFVDWSPGNPDYLARIHDASSTTISIPTNAAEIDAILGADETGWLFPLVP